MLEATQANEVLVGGGAMMMSDMSSSPIYDIAPPSRTSRRKRSKRLQQPPLIVRVLTILLSIIACLLLISTIYLFHLHHAHLQDGDVNEAVLGPGGSARQHKMGLANFLLQRHNEQHEQDKAEAQEESGWKGGSEENFIKLVNEISHHEDRDNDEKIKKEVSNNYLEIIQDWQKLQHTLLQNNTMLLPTSIPRTHTARAFSGLSSDQTPALKGAKRGTISCPDVDPRINEVLSSMLAFWNEPRGARDVLAEYNSAQTTLQHLPQQHPFIPKPLNNLDHQNILQTVKSSRRRYLTFEPDTGGFNNMRISFEIVVLLAALSGRTLVLPPEQVMYLLQPKPGDKRQGRRQYTDYYNLTDNIDLLRHVPIISAEEFLHLEGGEDGLIPLTGYNDTWTKHLYTVSTSCEERKKSDVFCEDLYDHYASHGLVGPITSEVKYANCLVFDENVFLNGNNQIDKLAPDVQKRIKAFCGEKRYPVYYNKTMHDTPVWHFETRDLDHRLLVHFYSILFFTDDKVGNFYKRFARDFFRYHDEVFCAAGKIILALQYENSVLSGTNNPMADLDTELVGGYSSLHVRRGDLQFKEVTLNSSQWYENTKELWKPNEILYIATDERNNSFFDDFRKKHSGRVRFFDDYKALANLDSIDQTLYGMIDTVVASRGSVFAGTWFSTFSGYIVRLRGYYGMSKYYTYYSYLKRKYFMHEWMGIGEGSLYAREYPTAWTGIDGDALVEKDEELPREDLGDKPLRDTLFPRAAMDKLKERMMKLPKMLNKFRDVS
mmetsp:Transcript_17049/g.25950  ORF Transcript_17049/g.25950 Transcript_17049/m.25950 type:complete len:773 (+) Transcript_17049:61-2379(+)